MKQELRQEPFPGCFMLFAGANYYPNGGVEDLVGVGEKKELEDWFLTNQDWREWAHVVSHATMQIVSTFRVELVFNKANGEIIQMKREFVEQ